ncbi:MAG: nucleoside phosphorylase [Propionibacteriaceae bacterium]|jgi:uridine phosphorylase|nr:nucleoside phosphorylase [Propionibacteriaceae bacterium]
MTAQPHIQLDASLGIDRAIVVGDPARVGKFRPFLSDAADLAYNREFRSLAGAYRGVRVLVLSTGVGAPSAGIAAEELVNIGVTTIVRVGSAGAMRQGIGLGELIIGTGVVRDDGLSARYVKRSFPAVPSPRLLSRALELAPSAHFGIIRSHDGFYMDDNEAVEAYWSGKGVLGADMESGILLTLGLLRGFEALSILNNVVLYQDDLAAGVNSLVGGEDAVAAGERASIELALNIVT